MVHIAGRMGTFLDGTVAVMVAFLQKKGADMAHPLAYDCPEVAFPLAFDCPEVAYPLEFDCPEVAYPSSVAQLDDSLVAVVMG